MINFIIEISVWTIIISALVGLGFLLGLKVGFDKFINSGDEQRGRRQIGFASEFNNQSIQPVSNTAPTEKR